MSIMPHQSAQLRMPRAARTAVFWAVIIALAAVLWLAAPQLPSARPHTMAWITLISAAVVVLFSIFTAISTHRRETKQRQPGPPDVTNRPLG
jgi:choline-glycine betaine transporter